MRIYREAFSQISGQLDAQKVLLVGLGCGTGLKEQQLCLSLKATAGEALFAAIDVSKDLVVESAGKLVAAGAEHRRSLACDLAESEFIGQWLHDLDKKLSRLLTFFGLVPNLMPSTVIRLFRAVLRPGDRLLVSAHLAPVDDEHDLSSAMQSVLPQYDNPETLAWLQAAVRNWDLESLLEPGGMTVGEVEGVPAFRALARWKSDAHCEKWGRSFSTQAGIPLQLFSSLRYTPRLFQSLLRDAGFDAELLSITACRQEAIWCVRVL